jgi:hypothetical protein
MPIYMGMAYNQPVYSLRRPDRQKKVLLFFFLEVLSIKYRIRGSHAAALNI